MNAPRAAPSAPADQTGAFDAFRITAPHTIAATLRALAAGGVALRLQAAGGPAVEASMSAVDADRGSIGLMIERSASNLQALLAAAEITATGQLDNVHLQFGLRDPVLVHGAQTRVLSGPYPDEIFRFQRRDAYRVRPLRRARPLARLPSFAAGAAPLALRVLDVSSGGCALLLPAGAPAPAPGAVFNDAQLELDADTRFTVHLRLQHSTLTDDGGQRLGCEFLRADAAALRALQRFIDRTQQQSRRFAAG